MNVLRPKHLLPMAAALFLVTACKGADKPAETTPEDSVSMAAQAAAWKAGRIRADSLFRAAPEMADVVKKLGASRYDVADDSLAAIARRESAKTRDCYTKIVKEIDPTLSLVTYMLLNYGAAGWDLVRVEQSQQTSPAGGAVIACINSRAKTEWKLPTKGVKPGAHLVRIDYAPDTARSGR
jgi:hypothetical protein